MMIPDYPRIYLQPNEAGIGRHTWCQDRIDDTDIEYIRSDIADELMASLQRLLERVAALDDASPNEEIGGFVGDGSWRSLGTVAEIRRLAAALDSPPDHGGGEGWQSIETAPKDTPILVGRGRVNLGDGTYKDGIVLEAQWNTDERGWYFGGYVGGWLQVDPEHPPTHWQPLPEPPRAALRSQP